MSSAQIMEQIANSIPENEQIIGQFKAVSSPSFWWRLLAGPLVHAFLIKQYHITITNKSIYFAKLNMLSKLEMIDSFDYIEIRGLSISPGPINYSLGFEFGNGNKLALKVVKKGLSDQLIAHLKEHFFC